MNRKQQKARLIKLNEQFKAFQKDSKNQTMAYLNGEYIYKNYGRAMMVLCERVHTSPQILANSMLYNCGLSKPMNTNQLLNTYVMGTSDLEPTTQEEVDRYFPILDKIRNEANNSFDWEEAINILSTQHYCSKKDAFKIFVAWTKYLDARQKLAKAIDFN